MTVEYITDLSTDALGLVLFRLGSVRLIARTAVVNRAFRAAARVAEQARRRVCYEGHTDTVLCVAAAPDGRILTAGLAGLNKRLPFEVCAAIDYGIAVAAPVYAGMRLSSFDVFASAERRAAGRQNATVMRPGGKMCGGT